MKTKISSAVPFLLAGALWAAFTGASFAQTPTNFVVTTPDAQFNFQVDGTNDNPTLDLPAGATYVFNVSTTPGFHPLNINNNPDFPYTGNNYGGADPQNISTGDIILTIPSTGYPNTLYYICGFHGFFGTINVLPPVAPPDPPAPPPNTIISIVLTPTSVTLKSTGTNTTYNLVPEFNSNLVTGTWQSVPSFTNNFDNGTNTTSFNRLEPICGSNVFLRISQRPPD